MTRANQEYVDSRYSHPSTEIRPKARRRVDVDPNFTKAMSGFIKAQCPQRQERKERMSKRNEVLRALYESRG